MTHDKILSMDMVKRFEEHRDYLFAIAYRMLGTVMGAEDMVQETYLRWEKIDHSEVKSPKAYLASIITRLCIDHLKSARMRREQYIGPWLPEPLVSEPEEQPAGMLAQADSLSMAFLVLLESLKPEARAVYLLREVFDYGYGEIAEIMDKSEAACRKMVSRSRRHIQSQRPKQPVSKEKSEQVAKQFLDAIYDGEMQGLMQVLDAEVVWTSDGGGRPGVARRPVKGAEKVGRFILGIANNAPPDSSAHLTQINGTTGILIETADTPTAALAIQVVDNKVKAVHAVVNPDKLRHLQ